MLALRDAKLTDVVSTLRGFVITTYDVPVDRLAAQLPRGLSPDVVRLDDGRERSLVSAVSFLNTDFYVRYAPFVRLTAPQTNFRAYVRWGEQRVVWFFGTVLGSPFVVLPRYLWKLPWAYGRHRVAHQVGPDGGCRALSFHATSELGAESLELEGTGVPTGRLDGFADADETSLVLTHPLVGTLRRRDGRCATYAVDHDRLVLERAHASVARHELFERLELVAPGQAPHSVLVQRETRFHVRLPPRVVELDD